MYLYAYTVLWRRALVGNTATVWSMWLFAIIFVRTNISCANDDFNHAVGSNVVQSLAGHFYSKYSDCSAKKLPYCMVHAFVQSNCIQC